MKLENDCVYEIPLSIFCTYIKAASLIVVLNPKSKI